VGVKNEKKDAFVGIRRANAGKDEKARGAGESTRSKRQNNLKGGKEKIGRLESEKKRRKWVYGS